MKTILLLRHAKSSWRDESLADFDRPLAKRGRQAAADMAAYLSGAEWRPAQILCSPSRRTRETLDAIERTLNDSIPVRFERALYLADAPGLLRRLRRLSDTLPSVMVVGHNPGLERLTALLAGNGDAIAHVRLSEKFPTGALAVLTTSISAWRELAAGGARLEAFLRPRDLTGT